MPLNIPVVCGSVRQNRNSIIVSRYFAQRLEQAGHITQVVDFTELPLPFVDADPNPSKLKKQYPYPNVQQWSAIADQADGFIFVAPEYNHGMSGVLKNALDWLYPEFNDKPAALVGVSDGAGSGIRAVEQLRAIMANFALYDIRQGVNFAFAQKVFDEDSNLLDQSYLKRIDGLLNALAKVAEVMKQLRA
jgi:NAD(P)H-dependent FMN reductase